MASGGGSAGARGGGISEHSYYAVTSSYNASASTVSEGSANLDMAGGEDMKKLLECPICMKILVSPIYQCQLGHTICNACKPKLTKCSSCEAPFGATRNLALESILQTVTFSCNHHHKGCNVLLKIQDLQQHHEECDFSSGTDANAVSKGLTNLSMKGGEDFKRLLECPICMEILVSPIYQCQRGHRICNTCKPKLIKCATCEAPIGDTRNLALESILQTVLFSCSHHHKGCSEVLKIQDLQEHHEECEFRPLKCHLSDMDDCNGTFLYLNETLSHLQNFHKLKSVKSEEGHFNVFRSENFIWKGGSDSDDPAKYTWAGELFHFDENAFVAFIRRIGPVTYFGFYLIGPKSDASKYSVKISVQKDTLENVIFKSKVTSKFTSIRDFQEVWEDWKLPHEAMIHDDVFLRDKFFPGREIDKNHYWDIVYTINKI